jgi:hypothetical protein
MPSTKSERSGLYALLLFIAIFAANLFVLQLYWKTFVGDRNLLNQDFLGYYTAASLPRSSIYDINRQRELQTSLLGKPYGVPAGVLLFNHPPFLVPVVRLLNNGNYFESYQRWAALLFAISVACSVIIYLLLRDAWHTVLVSTLSAFTALLFYPSYRSIEIGTDTTVALLAVLLWAFFLIKDKDRAAGLALSLTLIKPHLAIILGAATLARSRRAFLMFLTGGVILTSVSMFYVGLKGILDLVQNIKLSANGEALGVFFVKQYSFMGLLARLGMSRTVVAMVGWLAFGLIVVLVSVYRPTSSESWIGFVLLLAVFFAPNLHFHDLALLLLPMTLIARRVRGQLAPLIFFPLSPLLILAVGLTVASYSMQVVAAVVIGGLKQRRDSYSDLDNQHALI